MQRAKLAIWNPTNKVGNELRLTEGLHNKGSILTTWTSITRILWKHTFNTHLPMEERRWLYRHLCLDQADPYLGDWNHKESFKLTMNKHLGGYGWRSCKIYAFLPQGPQFNSASAEIWIFMWPNFPLTLTQLTILPNKVNEYQCLLGANLRWISVLSRGGQRLSST